MPVSGETKPDSAVTLEVRPLIRLLPRDPASPRESLKKVWVIAWRSSSIIYRARAK